MRGDDNGSEEDNLHHSGLGKESWQGAHDRWKVSGVGEHTNRDHDGVRRPGEKEST